MRPDPKSGVKARAGRGFDRRHWVSIVPYGLNQQHPNAYSEIVRTVWDNRDRLGYAFRILRDGCCDGCSLGTSGMYDWTMDGIHLCAVRLNLLRLNTMPAMDWTGLGDVSKLQKLSDKELRKLGRLAVPMIRRKGDRGFQRLSWDDAVKCIAVQLRSADPKRVAWFVTSRGLTNEAYYAHQKVARFLGTNNVDTSARICHAPSTAALNETVGVAATTCSYSDWIGTDLLIFMGSNPANNQPVSMKYLYYAKRAGTKVVLVNPYREPGMDRYWVPSVTESALFGTKIADEYLQIRPGGDIAFHYGVLKHLLDHEQVNRTFIESRTVGFSALMDAIRQIDWSNIEAGSGLTRAEIERFADMFGRAKSAIIVWSMGITQHRHGTDNVKAIVNLQLARGFVGREHTGLMPIRGHSGVQGGAEMGAQPSSYCIGRPVSEEHASALEALWGFRPPTGKGLHATASLEAAARGEVDVLWQSGGNFKGTLPSPADVQRAMSCVKLRVHQDIVLSQTMLVDPADTVILLPSRTRYEQRGGGTQTSSERRVIFSPEIPGPRLAESRDEWEIPVLVASAVNPEEAARAFPWQDTQDIRKEIESVCPTYAGVSALRRKGDQFQYGGRRLLEQGFATPDGKGRFSVVELPQTVNRRDTWFMLSTRRGKQFNSMVHSEIDPLNGAERDHILISFDDAELIGLREHDPVLLRNEHGSFEGRVKPVDVKPGTLQGHWPEVNVLIPSGRCDSSGVPDYNVAVELIAVNRKLQSSSAAGC
jgi:molybdopterin-dependent oxidoreductase alpha subunit